MNYIMIFFVSTMVLALLIYNIIFKFFFDWRASQFSRWYHTSVITGGLFIVNYIAFKGLAELEQTNYPIWYPIGITLFMFFMRSLLIILLNPSNHFYSSKEDKPLSPFPEIHYKKVKEYDSDWIGIYPRITIHDIEIEEKLNLERQKITELTEAVKELYNSRHIIFDSSDFTVINKTFGSFGDKEESFSKGRQIKFNDETILIDRVQVDFMNVYDDYSGTFGHTHVYKGKDTPYNIQIIVFARRIAL